MGKKEKSNKGNWTEIPNLLLELLMRHPGIPGKGRVLLCIIRMTFGWHRPWAELDYGKIHFMTGVKKPNISRAICDLLRDKVIRRRGTPYRFEYTINNPRSIIKLITVSENQTNCYQNDNPTVIKTVLNCYQNDNPHVSKERNKKKKDDPTSDLKNKSESGLFIDEPEKADIPPEEFNKAKEEIRLRSKKKGTD